MLNSNSESPVSRQSERGPVLSRDWKQWGGKKTASELNYSSQPISSPRHCILFRVKVKTKRKWGLIIKKPHHENRAHASKQRTLRANRKLQTNRYTVQLRTAEAPGKNRKLIRRHSLYTVSSHPSPSIVLMTIPQNDIETQITICSSAFL